MKIMIIGHGFVGQAVDYGFTHPKVEKMVIDPKYGHTHPIHYDIFYPKDLLDYNMIFVCVPTSMADDGSVDTSILDKIVNRIVSDGPIACPVVIKSTVTPDWLKKLETDSLYSNFVYNPEFLTEKNANEQFVNPEFHLLGGRVTATQTVQYLYSEYSIMNDAPFLHCTMQEASFIKYAINTFLATKVTFFNNLYDAVNDYDGNVNWSSVLKGISFDKRIGKSHSSVPGFDGKQGFGGACFPKDTSAFTKFSNRLPLLEKVIKINNEYRSNYELDTREIEQHVNYGQTKEEQ